jgi:protein-S-isoprenylcysteine O-methyltransferase Ste14
MESRSPLALIDTPPVWLLAGMALAWAQARLLPVFPAPGPLRVLGAAVAVAGVVVLVLAAREFRRHRTSIIPRERPSALLTTGPYAVSRNPIYLADAMILAGLILAADLAALPLVPAFAALVTVRFIRGEEAGCRATFGPAWDAYAARVRRWL